MLADYCRDKENFMNTFSSVVRREIKQFADRINSSKADVLILMARKAACLFQALVEIGYIPSSIYANKVVITDRVLDLNDCWDFSNKCIDIVDDVIISGSTIAKIVRTLKLLNGDDARVNVIVLAVNKTSFRMDFTAKNGHKILDPNVYMRLAEEECIELSSNLAKSFSAIGNPYDIDFPSYNEVIISEQHIEKILNSIYWDSYDAGNLSHEYMRHRVITLFPNALFLKQLKDSIGCAFDNTFHFKIRLYLIFQGESSDVKLRVIPLAILNETQFREMDVMFERLASLTISNETKTHYKSISAKTRFVQYVFSLIIGKIFAFNANLSSSMNLNELGLRLIFGDKYPKEISKSLFCRNKGFLVDFPDDIALSNDVDCLGFSPKLNGVGGYDINERLAEPFEFWLETQETKARELLKNKNISYSDEYVITPLTRLEKGFSLVALMRFLNNCNEKYNVEAMTSLFVDRAIDYGIIVPITYINKESNVVCRAYRHGEDFPFSKQDKLRIQLFLENFFGAVDGGELAKINTEKIIVLFLQLGVLKDYSLLNMFKNYDNSDHLLSVKFCVHGAVAVTSTSETDETKNSHNAYGEYITWLTSIFVEDGILELSPSSKRYDVYRYIATPVEGISEPARAKIEELAIMIAKWYNYAAKEGKVAPLFRRNLIGLTACVTEDHFASAILAELDISKKDWIESMRPALISGKRHRIIKAVENTRNYHERSAFTAMNSARMKYRYFRHSTEHTILSETEDPNTDVGEVSEYDLKELISQVEELFDKNADSFKYVWNRIWMEFRSTLQSKSPIHPQVLKCVKLSFIYNICYRMIEYSSKKCFPEIKTKKDTCEIRNEIIEFLTEYKTDDDLGGDFVDFLNGVLYVIDNESDYAVLYNECIEKVIDFLDKRNYNSNRIVEEVSRHLNKNREINMINCYAYSYAFEINKGDENLVASTLLEIINRDYNNASVGVIRYGTEYTQSDITRIVVLLEQMTNTHAQSIFKNIFSIIKNKIVRTYVMHVSIDASYNFKKWGDNEKAKSNLYKNYFKAIDHHVSSDPSTSNCLFYVSKESTSEEDNTAWVDLFSQGEWGYKMHDTKSVDLAPLNANTLPHKVTKFKSTVSKIGIITILDCEANAVMNEFDLKLARGKVFSKKFFYTGSIKTSDKIYDLCMIQTISSGADHASDAYRTLSSEFTPDYFILLGICGSLKPDKANICDVVIPNKVIDLRKAKEVDGAIEPEFSAVPLSAPICDIINTFFTMNRNKTFISNIKGSPFNCVSLPVADNGHVISDKEAEIRKQIALIDRKCGIVDTESASAIIGEYLDALYNGKANNGLMIIRGVSDLAFKKPSKDPHHDQASSNVAQILREIIIFF